MVKGVTLYVRRGEAVGLLGPNGAGKTTVFYMITGLIAADRGRIELDGYDVTALPMYQRARLGIGYLPQEASIFRGLNVEDNIRAVLEVVEPDRRRREADLNALLEEFNIARLRKTPAIALSGGERRRVEIARALATRPSYMLLDEPFAGIDPIAVGDIQALVRHLTNRGIGVLITDHNVRETLGLTDRAYIIYSGRGADGGPGRRHRQQSGRAPALSGRGIPPLSARSCAQDLCNAALRNLRPLRLEPAINKSSKKRTSIPPGITMALSQRLEFRQSQALVMTPQLMQAIKLLQLSSLDLAAYVEAELEKNPLLERASDDEARRRRPREAETRAAAPTAKMPPRRATTGTARTLETQAASSMEEGPRHRTRKCFPR